MKRAPSKWHLRLHLGVFSWILLLYSFCKLVSNSSLDVFEESSIDYYWGKREREGWWEGGQRGDPVVSLSPLLPSHNHLRVPEKSHSVSLDSLPFGHKKRLGTSQLQIFKSLGTTRISRPLVLGDAGSGYEIGPIKADHRNPKSDEIKCSCHPHTLKRERMRQWCVA